MWLWMSVQHALLALWMMAWEVIQGLCPKRLKLTVATFIFFCVKPSAFLLWTKYTNCTGSFSFELIILKLILPLYFYPFSFSSSQALPLLLASISLNLLPDLFASTCCQSPPLDWLQGQGRSVITDSCLWMTLLIMRQHGHICTHGSTSWLYTSRK